MPGWIRTAIALALIINIIGCSTMQPMGPQAMEGAMEAEPITDYRLRPGDIITIKVSSHPELTVSEIIIGPDGRIALEMIDYVLVAGLTPQQADELITREYSKYLVGTDLSVVVNLYSGLKVFVGGEVGRPGYVDLQGNLTLTQAVLMAGGASYTGKTENVLLIRKGPGDRPVSTVVDMATILTGEHLENDIYLKPADIIYIPKTWIAKTNLFVNQYIKGLIMVDTVMNGVGYALGYKWASQ